MFGLRKVVLRPVVFVDVDGTISPSQYPQDEYFYSSWNGGHYFPTELRAALNALPAEKIWLTGWGEEAEDTFNCGWRTLAGDRELGDLWKYHAIREYEEANAVSKIVWLDDEISLWQPKMKDFSARTLKIATQASKGLSPQHLLLVNKFLSDN